MTQKGAAVVTTLLDLHEGACAAGKFGDEVRCDLARLHDVGNREFRRIGQPCFRREFFDVAEHARDAWKRRPGFGGDLCGASCDDYFGAWAFAVRAADGLARLALGFGCDGAGVDDDEIAVCLRMGAHDLALVGVQPAAERLDVHTLC